MSLTSKAIFGIMLLLLAGCSHTVTDYPSARESDVRAETRAALRDVLDEVLSAQRRLYQVSGPMMLANAGLCPRRSLSLGFETISDFDLKAKELQNVAYEAALLGSDAIVLGVIPTSQAWDRGIRPGDTVMVMNGKTVRNAADWRARLRRIRDADKDIVLGLIRDGRAYEVAIKPVPSCNYRLIYDADDSEINAGATGTTITINKGMMDFMDDDELAVIIGHELAHNLMHHIRKTVSNQDIIVITGGIIDGITGFAGMGSPVEKMLEYMEVKQWSPAFEKEADYVGLYLLARGGGYMDSAPKVWRRLGVNSGVAGLADRNPFAAHTHPMSTERAVIQKTTIAEIHDKRRKGQDLMPNLRIPWVYGQKYSRWDVDEEDPWIDDDLNH